MNLNWLDKMLTAKAVNTMTKNPIDEVCVNFDPVLSEDIIRLLSQKEQSSLNRKKGQLLPRVLNSQCALDEYERALQ